MTSEEMQLMVTDNDLVTDYLKYTVKGAFEQKLADLTWLRDFLNILIDERSE